MATMRAHGLQSTESRSIATAVLAAVLALFTSTACGSGGSGSGGTFGPASVSEPRPDADQIGVDRITTLGWTAPAEAVTFRVHLGVGSVPGEPDAEVEEPRWQPNAPLERDRPYRWRVDWVRPDGSIVTGPTWSFRTARQTIVPDEREMVQAAIEAAPADEVILLRPGTYRESLDFRGKAVTVRSLTGPGETVLEGAGAGPVVTFRSGESRATALEGLTIRGGGGERGGGILCRESSPTLRDNTITENVADRGAGVYCYRSEARLLGNRIRDNRARLLGGGVAAVESQALIESNTITGNAVLAGEAILIRGGGVFLRESEDRLIGNRIAGNTLSFVAEHEGSTFSAFGAGVYARGRLDERPAVLEGNRIESNGIHVTGRAWLTVAGGGVWCHSGVIRSNDVLGNEIRAESRPWGEPGDERPEAAGGGMYAGPGSRSINNWIARNRVIVSTTGAAAARGLARGGGLFGDDASSLHDTVAFNRAILESGSGQATGIGGFGHELELTNTILWNNGPGPDELDGLQLRVRHCLTTQLFEGEGNIAADPHFRGPGDFHLTEGSPCLDAGTRDGVSLPSLDHDGEARVQDGDEDGMALPDIGADELGSGQR